MMQKRILVAAHMGQWGGNIPGNTAASFDLALRQGADIVELDVTRSADGELFVFHPQTERRRLGLDIDIRTMPAREVEKLRFLNVYGSATEHRVTRLGDILALLRGRCIINIDKFFDNPAEIARLVRGMGMQDQVIVKTPATAEFFDRVAESAPDLPYMPFAYDEDTASRYLDTRRDLRFIGVEAVFYRDSSMLASDEYIEMMHGMGKKVWINSIRYSDRRPLAGSRCDDGAVTGDPDAVWGWMARKGYDMIQTDWVDLLCRYLRDKGY